jgi:acyl-CoA synthetase (AMP-forming)/AMP-acid ligase II
MTGSDARTSPRGLATLVDLLGRRAGEWGERRRYIWVSENGEEGRLTYAGLERLARAVAAALQRQGLAGERVLLLYPAGLDFVVAFFGCLLAGAVAVPAYPPGSRRTLPRVLSIVRDARPAAVLTSSHLLSRLAGLAAHEPELGGLRWIATDETPEELAAGWLDPGAGPESTAFLQYTSGSTSTPKGVVVSHGSLLHNEEMIRRAFGQTEASVVVGWLPLYHDMGLIGNVLQPLYAGATCVLMSPMTFLNRPAFWLETICRYGGTTSGGPNFAYELCARKVTAEEKEGLDLAGWRVAFSGAEPVRAETLERFAAAFAGCGFRREAFYPCYGLAEATLFVSGGLVEEAPVVGRFDAGSLERHRVSPAEEGAGRELVSCGRSWLGQEVAIVDPETLRRCAGDAVGEIWVSGPSVAGG